MTSFLFFLAPAALAEADVEAQALVSEELKALYEPGGLTVEAAISRALESHPLMRKKQAAVEQQEASLKKTDLYYVPQLTAKASYTRLSKVKMPDFGPIEIPQVLDNFAIGLQLAIPLSDYFLRFPSLSSVQSLQLDAVKADVRGGELELRRQLEEMYWNWVRGQLTIVVVDQSRLQIQELLKQIEARYEVQQVSKADVLQLKAQEAEVLKMRTIAEAQVALAARLLRQEMGAGQDEVLTVGENFLLEPEFHDMEAVDSLLEEALQNRPEIVMLDASIKALKAAKRVTRMGMLPRLDAFGQFDYNNPNQRVFLSDGGFDESWAVGLSLSWNLSDFLDAFVSVDETEAQVRQLESDKAQLERQLATAIASALTGLEVAKTTYQSSRLSMDAAQESYRIREELFAHDRATTLEMVDAESEWTRVRIDEVNALIDYRLALAQLRNALGRR